MTGIFGLAKNCARCGRTFKEPRTYTHCRMCAHILVSESNAGEAWKRQKEKTRKAEAQDFKDWRAKWMNMHIVETPKPAVPKAPSKTPFKGIGVFRGDINGWIKPKGR